jgi:hypothetical protein
MKAMDRPFTKIINETTQFLLPVFQRDYSRTESGRQRLRKASVAPPPSDESLPLGYDFLRVGQ